MDSVSRCEGGGGEEEKIKYPIYIVSKGRWEKPYTANMFLDAGIDFRIAVEPQEYEFYRTTIPEENIFKLPFSNLGLGSFPARNACWEHSIARGYRRHFIFDDNIRAFRSFSAGARPRCSARKALVSLEKFTDLYSNIAFSGYGYTYFVTKMTRKAFFLNAHVYSGILINNDVPFRWRLKYNEDVDLCLQALDKGWCTVLLNAYLIDKISTVAKLKGGNQDELYLGNATEKKILKAKSLETVWPQYVKTKIVFHRPHHYVNWRTLFTHPLRKKGQ